MTPLNEKAREYAQREFCQIGYCGGETPCLFNANLDYEEMCGIVHAAYDAYIAGYTEALRWRDVNVELPPFENVPISERTKYIVKVCTGSMTPKVDIRIWSLSSHRKWFGEMDWVSVTHWRPIE